MKNLGGIIKNLGFFYAGMAVAALAFGKWEALAVWGIVAVCVFAAPLVVYGVRRLST